MSASSAGVATRSEMHKNTFAQGAYEQWGGVTNAAYSLMGGNTGLARAMSGVGAGLGIAGLGAMAPQLLNMMGLGGGSQAVLGKRLLHAFGIRQLLVTEGEYGAWLLQNDGAYFHTGPTESVTGMVDSVGAGDGFAAVFLLGLVQGWPVQLTLERAQRFAGEICRLRGAIPDSDDFYRPFITAWQLAGGGAA